MKKLIIIPLCVIVFVLWSCEKNGVSIIRNNQIEQIATKSEIYDMASVVDDIGGGVNGLAYGAFEYPNGWCHLIYQGYECEISWTNGLPTIESFTSTSTLFDISEQIKTATFTIPQEEITASISFILTMRDTTNGGPLLPPFLETLEFKINIPNKIITIQGIPINFVNRTYNFNSYNRNYGISFTTNSTDNTISNVSVTLTSHPYDDDPAITYTYSINGNQVTFNILGSTIIEMQLPNGSTTLNELTFEDSFTMLL